MCSIQCNRGLGDEDGHDGDYDQMQQGIPFKNNGHSVVGVQRLKNPGKNLPFFRSFTKPKKATLFITCISKKVFYGELANLLTMCLSYLQRKPVTMSHLKLFGDLVRQWKWRGRENSKSSSVAFFILSSRYVVGGGGQQKAPFLFSQAWSSATAALALEDAFWDGSIAVITWVVVEAWWLPSGKALVLVNVL